MQVLEGVWCPAGMTHCEIKTLLAAAALGLLLLWLVAAAAARATTNRRPPPHLCLGTTGQLPAHVTMGSAARRQRPSPATFFGRGQVEALLAQVHAAEPERCEGWAG